jgi:hypothetical protein
MINPDQQWIEKVTTPFRRLDSRLAESARRHGASTDAVDGLFLTYARMCVDELLNPPVMDAVDLACQRANRMSGLRTKLSNLENTLRDPDAFELERIPKKETESMREEALRLYAVADTASSYFYRRSHEVGSEPVPPILVGVEAKIRHLKDVAAKEGLAFRMTFDEYGHGWAARFTTRHHHQPLCVGVDKTDLERALNQLLGKAERSIAPLRKRIAAAVEEEHRFGRDQLKAMGVR